MRPRVHDARADAGQLEHLVVADGVDLARLGHEARVGGVDAVHVGVDLAVDIDAAARAIGCRRGSCFIDRGQGDGGGVRAAAAERRDVVVLVDALEAGDDDDLALVQGLPHALGGDLLMRALVCVLSVTMPTWAPVKLMAGSPSAWMAMAIRAMEICSPVARSMSISRAGGCSLISLGQLDQLVGGVAAGADDDDDLVAGLLGADGPPRRRHDPLRRWPRSTRRTSAPQSTRYMLHDCCV